MLDSHDIVGQIVWSLLGLWGNGPGLWNSFPGSYPADMVVIYVPKVWIPVILSALPMLPWLMKSYPEVCQLDKRQLNCTMSKCRLVVECAFGQLKVRWPRLLTCLNYSILNALHVSGQIMILWKSTLGWIGLLTIMDRTISYCLANNRPQNKILTLFFTGRIQEKDLL